MYPVYPLICAVAAHGFQTASTVVHRLMNPHAPLPASASQSRLSGKLSAKASSGPPKLVRSVSSSTLDEFASPAYAPRSAHDGVILALARLCVLVSACLGVSRVVSSHRNFFGRCRTALQIVVYSPLLSLLICICIQVTSIFGSKSAGTTSVHTSLYALASL